MPDVRADFNRPAVVRPQDFLWVQSPGGEVQRMMLDRLGDEVAVATSLVRYPPESRFPSHEHGLGEEYLVLEGEFGDEHGRYPPGTYVRNPPGSRHTPFSDPGCVIWVKLRQFDREDHRHIVTSISGSIPQAAVDRHELHRHRGEAVTAIAAAPGAVVDLPAGEHVQEVLVVEGVIEWRKERIERWGWLRLPAGDGDQVVAAGPSRLLHKTRPSFALGDAPPTGATSSASAGR